MLETRMPPVSTRTRRLDAPPRPAARASSAAREAPPARGRSISGNTALETAPAPPVSRPSTATRQSRLGRSEMRLMGLATTCTAIVCGLLLLYLAAYAHVSRLGYDQAQARTQLRRNQLENESLRAQRDRLQSRRFVIQEATALGMTPRGSTPVSYITARASRTRPEEQDARLQTQTNRTDNAKMAAVGEQETNGVTTADSSEQPSFNH